MNDPAIQGLLSARDAALQSQIQHAVAAKALSAVKQQGQAAVELLQAAATTGRASGKGTHFDRQA